MVLCCGPALFQTEPLKKASPSSWSAPFLSRSEQVCSGKPKACCLPALPLPRKSASAGVDLSSEPLFARHFNFPVSGKETFVGSTSPDGGTCSACGGKSYLRERQGDR